MSASGKTILDLEMFSGKSQLETFSNFKNLIPVTEMAPAPTPIAWKEGAQIDLPETYLSSGAKKSVREFLDRTSTSALLIIRDGKIRYEDYWHTGGQDVQWVSMSVAKSFVSALVGTLVDDGLLSGIDEPISDYIRVNAGSAYDGVSIRDVLTMSSGARWNEDYSDSESDAINLQLAVAGVSGTLEDFVAGMSRELRPGTVCRYNSGDTQALGLLVQKVSGTSVSEYMVKHLLHPLGTESAGYWWVDGAGNEATFAGLNLVARDFARLGELYRRGGEWNGVQIISREWIQNSTTITADHLRPAQIDSSIEADSKLGYGYQWWIPQGDRGVFAAIGVYNQFILVEPTSATTIVKLSANQRYGTSMLEADNLDDENLDFLMSLAAAEF